MEPRLKVLFLSRAYPPVVGGIERQNYELSTALAEIAEVRVIANTRGKKYLPFFYLTAFFQALSMVRRYDIVLLGDGVLAPLGAILKQLSGKPVCCVIHGLDITYCNLLYQRVWVDWALNRLDRLFAVGNETIRQAAARGVDTSRCDFIPNGVTMPAKGRDEAHGSEAGGLQLLTLGRLVPRKGVAWFIREVMPLLPDDIRYWVAGDGPEKEEILLARGALEKPERVTLLGPVSEEEKQRLLYSADLFLQPNIPVKNDMEGFGLVVLEAAAAGLPVLASRLEGLRDAIREGENGILVEPRNAEGYREAIVTLSGSPEKLRELGRNARSYVARNCQWQHIASRYLDALQTLAGPVATRQADDQ